MAEKKPNNIPLISQLFVCSKKSFSNIRKGKVFLKPFDMNEKPMKTKHTPVVIWKIFKAGKGMIDK